MKIVCGLLFANFLLLSQAFPAQPNPSSPTLSFVYNGETAEVGEFPHQLILQDDHSGKWEKNCGAVLISKDQALTASHCLDPDASPGSYRVLAGLHDKLDLEGVQAMTLKSAVLHPNFRDGSASFANDIAILTFDTSLELNDKVQPIAWNQDANLNFMGEQCEISGWGKLWEMGYIYHLTYPRHLHKATMVIIPNDECEELLNDIGAVLYDGHICPFNPSQGFAMGDSGGPLTCNHNGQPILAGLGSFLKSKSHFHPSVYAKVSYFKDFINDNLVY